VPTSIVVVYLNGGINPIFTGADAFSNQAFGVTGNNVSNLGNGVVIDNSLANAIPRALWPFVATVGIRHGLSDHGEAQRGLFQALGRSAPLALAHAIGGNAAIKAAVVGGNALPGGQIPAPVNGVSLQPVTDLRATLEALAGANPGPQIADRAGIEKGLLAAQAMSALGLRRNPVSLATVEQGYSAAIATVQKPVQVFNATEFNGAYGLKGTAVRDFGARMAAAELMVRSGTPFVLAEDEGWDSHGDSSGNNVRNRMSQRIAGPLRTFLSRMVEDTSSNRQVIVALLGDFHRSLPGSDHQPSLSALLLGRPFKNATTGRTDNRVALPGNTPSIPGFWQCLGAASKVDANPFGANPHGQVLAA
jgi:hypothetical protein